MIYDLKFKRNQNNMLFEKTDVLLVLLNVFDINYMTKSFRN